MTRWFVMLVCFPLYLWLVFMDNRAARMERDRRLTWGN